MGLTNFIQFVVQMILPNLVFVQFSLLQITTGIHKVEGKS